MQLAFLFLGTLISLIATAVAVIELVHYNKRRGQVTVLAEQVDHLQDALAQSELIRTQQMIDGLQGQEVQSEPLVQTTVQETVPTTSREATHEELVHITENAIHALLPKELSYELHRHLIDDAVTQATKKFAS
jgi:hypothetical protein